MANLDRITKAINKTYTDKGMPIPIGSPVPIDHISTGFSTLDDVLGGGWAVGKIMELWGTPGVGKSTLALHAIVECQEAGKNCVFIDVERAFNPEYAETIGVDNKKLIYVRPEYGEQALDIAYKYVESGEVSLVVLDSVASLLPKDTSERTMEQKEQATLARVLSRNIPKFIPLLDNNKCTFIFVNQIRNEIGKMFGNPEVTPGGETLKFGSFMRLELRHTEYIKGEEDAKIGDIVKALCKKTKSKEPFTSTLLRMQFGKGFDKGFDLLSAKLKSGEITKSGSWFLFPDEVKIQGEEGAIKKCLQNAL